MRITAVESTHMFVGTADEPVQILAVEVFDRAGRRVEVSVDGGAPVTATIADDRTARLEVPVPCTEPPGSRVPVRVRAVDPDEHSSFAVLDTELEVTEPGWTMFLVSHFHYDPVWWNTQGAYTSTWDAVDVDRPARTFDSKGSPAFTLLNAHIELALRDPDYTFVLAEVDYLKPFWDAHPEHRAVLRRLLAEGRLEIMGGTYNEPSTAISSAESTVRNAIHGAGYQRDILGADPATAWQLDVFGHDAQFPGLMADAGLTSSSWARGPFHQWGPSMRRWGDGPHPVEVMQFPAEFAWISPSGGSLLTAFQTHHYMSGWRISGGRTLAEAEQLAYRQFLDMRPGAGTRNILLPVGGDYSPPCPWVPQIHREWNARYVSPRFVSGLPSEFFAAVRAELDARGVAPSPQTRDMNPVYTGTAVSYTDVRQAQRRGETLLGDAEMWATLAGLVTGAGFPAAAVDKAWRQLLFGAHHDAVTGSPSDQVYLDLLTGWREVIDIGTQVHADATAVLAAQVSAGSTRDMVVFNPSSWTRTDVLALPDPGGVPVDDDGSPLPAVLEDGVLHVVVPEVPGVGLRTVSLSDAQAPRWIPLGGSTITNDAWEIAADPARGGGVYRLFEQHSGRDLLAEGEIGCELTVQAEYANHPYYGEGPWHLLPTGEMVARSRDVTATVIAQESPAGQRLVVTGDLGVLRYRHEITLWRNGNRLEITSTVDGFAGADQLIRVRWPSSVRDGLPVAEIADAVIGKDLGFPDVDVRKYPWTLDQPAQTWFALGATAVVEVAGLDMTPMRRPIGVAELVFDDERSAAELGTGLAVAFVQAGVTATTTVADGPRYGALEVDSNLPDVRVVVGVLGHNSVLDALVDEPGTTWLPAARPLREHWTPDADLRGLDTLPVLVVAAADEESLRRAVAALTDDLADNVITVPGAGSTEDWDGSSLAVLNRGTPSFNVDADGVLTLSLMRSCTGWPSGFWVDPPKRTTPDGSSFQLGHWTHTLHHALVGGTGDWRALDLPREGHAYNHPLTAVVRETGAGGTGPRTARLLGVTPDDRVILDAVKPAGNPLARGLSDVQDARDGVVVRMHETTGAPVTATVAGAWTSTETVDLLEGNATPADTLEVGAFGIRAVRLVPADRAADGVPLADGSHREPAQPVHSRYWLHNAGPAPRGNQPVGVFLDPPSTVLRHGRQITATVRVSSEVGDRDVDGSVALRVPPGWTLDRASIPYALGPAGFVVTDVTVTAPADVEPGRYWLAASVEYGGQEFGDVTALDVPDADGRVDATAGLFAEIGVDAVEATGVTDVPVVVRNTSADRMTGCLWVLSPQETWDGIGPACRGVDLGPGQSTTCVVTVDAGAIPAGGYWLGVKIAGHGETRYSATVPLRVKR